MNDSLSNCKLPLNVKYDVIDKLIRELHTATNEKSIKKLISGLSKETLFDTNPINLKNQSGFSPKLITTQIIVLLCKKQKLTCAQLDFWFSLKRIGDYGQILQAKQLGIPLFTDDKMQILLSLATRTSSVFSIDDTKAIWYSGKDDMIVINKPYNTSQLDGIKRKTQYNIDSLLQRNGLNLNIESTIEKTAEYIFDMENKNANKEIDIVNFKDSPCQQIYIDYTKSKIYGNIHDYIKENPQETITEYNWRNIKIKDVIPYTVYTYEPINTGDASFENQESNDGFNLYVYYTGKYIFSFTSNKKDLVSFENFIKDLIKVQIEKNKYVLIKPVCNPDNKYSIKLPNIITQEIKPTTVEYNTNKILYDTIVGFNTSIKVDVEPSITVDDEPNINKKRRRRNLN